MVPLVALSVLVAAGPRPCNGPSLPLVFLGQCKLKSMAIGTTWCRGLYTHIDYLYASHKPIEVVAAQYRTEVPKTTGTMRDESGKSHSWFRNVGSVHQEVYVGSSGGDNPRPGSYTTIHVRESVDPLVSMPRQWNAKAFASKPPAAMGTIPFLPARRADTVTLSDFHNRMERPGIYKPNGGAKDLVTCSARLPQDYNAVLVRAQAWAVKNGYQKTKWESFFRPGSGMFEFDVRPNSYGDRKGTEIVMHSSKRRAKHRLPTAVL